MLVHIFYYFCLFSGLIPVYNEGSGESAQLHCSHAQSMDVNKDSCKTFDLLSHGFVSIGV